ncbi:site-specific integrase [Peribacillus frigoritolerans]|uniref:tyrosine-type recombinase/integrase n=1 Tax=Peribacillus frigoritolerans TaxID=450367 RepID=UPI002B2507F3|nr:site-specific integrase [Peribacillus frigoritolerans]MEB2492159.1 site-specific integrase [Peribacillus frigoritolerans]
MARKSDNVNYGLKVEQGLKYIPNLGEEVIQYYITEDGIPLYEVNRWVEYVSVNSYKTGGNYASKFVIFLRFLEVKYKIHYRDVVSKEIIVDFIKYLLYGDEVMVKYEGNRSLNSIKGYVSVIKSFYEWLEDEEQIQNPIGYGVRKNTGNKYAKKKFLYGQIYNFVIDKDNITKYLKYQEKHSHLRWYSDAQFDKIIAALRTRRDKLVFRTLKDTGMRIGECLGLHISHYDFHEGILRVIKSSNVENKATVKTKERDLYISTSLNNDLLDYIRADRFEADVNGSEYLFLNHKGSAKGTPLEQKNYLKILKRAAKRAGFDPKEIITHAGRSTKAQKLLEDREEGLVTDGFIKEEMGWSSIDTLDMYVKAFDARKRKETAKAMAERRVWKPGEDG